MDACRTTLAPLLVVSPAMNVPPDKVGIEFCLLFSPELNANNSRKQTAAYFL